ncbi:MAG TPA: phosphotransferase, partial [Caldilineaceae bacterium]|nr:phosphotransferase [Caldilineaceae bacterium]
MMTRTITLPALEAYLSHHHNQPVQLIEVRDLSDRTVTAVIDHAASAQSLKVFGYGRAVLIRYRAGGEERRVVLHTAPANQFGYENRADRAAGLLLSYDTYNTLPRHVAALDVGILIAGDLPAAATEPAQTDTPAPPPARLLSLAKGDEFFLLSHYVEGKPYAHDLQRLRDGGELAERDLLRAQTLALYLAEIHAVKYPVSPGQEPAGQHGQNRDALYRRRIRDTVGSGEGIMGLLDSYPADFPLAGPRWLEQVEKACVAWRWRIKDRTHRLCQVHGDYHPFNILFSDDEDFYLLDRSRGAWGEAADDVSCLAINYLFFSLQRSGALAPPFRPLWDRFWRTYLERTGDRELLEVVAPFFVWRALVLASPTWYNTADAVRRALFRFIEAVLQQDAFDPDRIDDYLAGPA